MLHSPGGGVGDGVRTPGEGDGEGEGTGIGDGLRTRTRPLSSCTMRASHILKGPLLAEDSRGDPRLEATRSAIMSALRSRGEVVVTSARTVRSSTNFSSRCG
jgi:hypothetical protein